MPALDGKQVGLVAGLSAAEKKAILALLKKLGASAALLINKKACPPPPAPIAALPALIRPANGFAPGGLCGGAHG